ncbi:hypothetical protein QBC38DRAFT_468711 [Podospora fimiseda]|uniref:Nucleotide exchange factor SIL1 n=1 Tax=Podospora fimiseda TaxID=252190 RepID=A0AAN7H4F1_9PEZI|nr:hypothetical protein QBC38DRAFT_468711 [Podospora fimiseda]
MARHRLKMLPLNLIALLNLMVLGIGATSEDASPPSPSPSADIELICHTDNPAECYPKIFQATNEFQIVKPDQDLPIGLHVRLNVQTGQKEAKINNPDEAENPALAGLSVDHSVVVVDQDDQQEQEQIPIYANAPKYSSAGKIKPPSPPSSSSDSSDGSQFLTSLSILKKGLEIDGALDMLSDISHDIYYGLKITEDYETLRALFCLANTDLIFSSTSPQHTIPRARLAALTLASAVQNNPTALQEIEKHWSKLSNEWCPNTSTELGKAIFKLVPPSSFNSRQVDPSLTKARISSITGLLKSDLIRHQFLSTGGMERLLEVLIESESPEWEPAQRKAGLLTLDVFLDADMGATLGEWPRGIQASNEVCAQKDRNPVDKDESSPVSAECWDWYAKNFAARHKKDKVHWSHDLVKKLGEQRKVNNKNDSRQTTKPKSKRVKKGGRGKEEL